MILKGATPVFRDRITSRARDLAKLISPDSVPILVAYQKDRSSRGGECFSNVRAKVEKFGGEVVDGWVIWETPPLLIQAEFHSIWRTSVGGQSYQERNIHPHSMVYEDTAMARRWLAIAQRFHELAYPEGELQTPSFRVTPEMDLLMKEKGQILRQLNGDPADFGKRLP